MEAKGGEEAPVVSGLVDASATQESNGELPNRLYNGRRNSAHQLRHGEHHLMPDRPRSYRLMVFATLVCCLLGSAVCVSEQDTDKGRRDPRGSARSSDDGAPPERDADRAKGPAARRDAKDSDRHDTVEKPEPERTHDQEPRPPKAAVQTEPEDEGRRKLPAEEETAPQPEVAPAAEPARVPLQPVEERPVAAEEPAQAAFADEPVPSRREAEVIGALSALSARPAASQAGDRAAPVSANRELVNRISLWNGELKAEAARAAKQRSDLESERRQLLSQARYLPWRVRQGSVSLTQAAALRDGLWQKQNKYDELYDTLNDSAGRMDRRLATYQGALSEARRLTLSRAVIGDLEDSLAQARAVSADLKASADVAVANAGLTADVLAKLLPAMEFAKTRGVLWRSEARITLRTFAAAAADLSSLASRFPEAFWDMAMVDSQVAETEPGSWAMGLLGRLLAIAVLGAALVWLGRRSDRYAADVSQMDAGERLPEDVERAVFRRRQFIVAMRAALAFAFVYGALRILPLTPQAALSLSYVAAASCGYIIARTLLQLSLCPADARFRALACDDSAARKTYGLLRLIMILTAVFVPIIQALIVLDYGREDVIMCLELTYGLLMVAAVLLLVNSRSGPLSLQGSGGGGPWDGLRRNAYLLAPGVSLLAVALLVAAAMGYTNLAAYVARGTFGSIALVAVLLPAHRWLRGRIDLSLPPLDRDVETRDESRGQLARSAAQWGESLGMAGLAIAGALIAWGIRSYQLHQVLAYAALPFIDIKGAKVSILGLLWGLLVVAASTVVARLVRDSMRHAGAVNARWDEGVRHSISSFIYYGIVVAGVTVGILVTGMQLGVLTAFAGLVGIAVGFGSQDIAKNTICGMIIMLDGSINVGDFVDVSGQSGTIEDVNIRSTTIRTQDRRKVVVPNAIFYSQSVIVSSRKEARVRVTVDIGLAPDADLPQARELILQAAAQTEGVLPQPDPEVLLRALAASALNLQLIAWTNHIEEVPMVQQRLISKVWETLRAADIPFS